MCRRKGEKQRSMRYNVGAERPCQGRDLPQNLKLFVEMGAKESKKQKAASLRSLPFLTDTLPRYSPVLKVTG